MGKRLCYTQVGKKESNVTLVFLHGSTMTKEGMLPLAESLKEYNCVVLDLTAHGQSSGELPNSISDIAEDVEHTIEYLREMQMIQEKMVLLGYSMGGAITCEIALRKKIDMNGIVFLSSGADLKHHTPAVDQLKEVPAKDFKTKDILDLLFGSLAGEKEREGIKNAFIQTSVSDEIGYNDLMISNVYDCLDKAKEIDCPTLLVHGCEDKIVLPVAAVETWKQIENSQLFMVPYGGHALIYEDMVLVSDNIKRFVQTIRK